MAVPLWSCNLKFLINTTKTKDCFFLLINFCISVKGCLFNVRRDPEEKHDLWQRANKIATLLTSRLRGLWAQQLKREPSVSDPAANPSNFGYRWMPWMVNFDDKPSTTFRQPHVVFNSNQISPRLINQISNHGTTIAGQIACEGPYRNFLCILKSIF